MKPVLLLALALALAGCVKDGGQTDQESFKKKDTLLDHHVHANCPVKVNGAAGIHVEIDECNFTTPKGKITVATIKCEGLKGNTNAIPWGNRETSMTVTYYAPQSAYEFSDTFVVNVENGESETADCSIDGPTTGFGQYSLHFVPNCLKDSNKFLPGFQAKTVQCEARHDFDVEREVF